MAMKNGTFFLSCLMISAACVMPCWALRADVNYDGNVDFFDLAILADEWLETWQQEYLPMMVGSSRVRVFVPRIVARSDELECCYLDNTELWEIPSYEDSSLTLDTINYQCSQAADPSGNFGSVKFTSGSDVSPLHMRSKALAEPNGTDLSEYKCVELRYFVHNLSLVDQSKFCALIIQLFDVSGNRNEYNAAAYRYADEKPYLEPGWHSFVRLLTRPHYNVGDCDLSKIKRMQFKLNFHDAEDNYTSANVSVTFDRLEFFTPISTAQYALTFDDGYADNYNIAAYLTAKGLRATYYIIPALVGTAGYLTLDQLHTMHDNGHLIANHTWSHKHFINDNLTIPQYIEEVTRACQWLYENGFGDGARILAQPWGTGHITEEGIDVVLGKYIDQIRLTGKPENCAYVDYDPHRLYANGTTGAAGDAALAAAIADSTLRVFYTHSLGGGVWRTAFLAHIDAVAEAVENGEVEVVTMAELLEPSRY